MVTRLQSRLLVREGFIISETKVRAAVAIVDADAAMRGQLRTQLTALNLTILEFERAAECLAAPELQQLRCVISETQLPDMSGVELLRRLHGALPGVPVILYTHEADVPTAVEAMREGAADFIEKPAIVASVLQRVAQLLKSHP